MLLTTAAAAYSCLDTPSALLLELSYFSTAQSTTAVQISQGCSTEECSETSMLLQHFRVHRRTSVLAPFITATPHPRRWIYLQPHLSCCLCLWHVRGASAGMDKLSPPLLVPFEAGEG